MITISVRGPLIRLATVPMAAALFMSVLPVPIILAAVTPPCIPCVLPLMPFPAVMCAVVIPRWALIFCSRLMPALSWSRPAGLCTCHNAYIFGDLTAAGCTIPKQQAFIPTPAGMPVPG